MSMTAGFHTDDLLNKHPFEVDFQDWHSKYPTSTYITLVLKQVGEGEVTVFVRHGLYGDLIAGLEGAANQLREVVAKEMVQTWGFPLALARARAEPCTAACDNPTEAHCTDHCGCYEAGHEAGLEAQRERVGEGSV